MRTRVCLTSIHGHRLACRSASSDAPWQTHAVFNQAPPLEGVDVFSSNLPLVEAVAARGRRLGRASAPPRSGALVGGEPQQPGAPGEREQARCCARTTATATASTRSSSTRPGTQLMQLGVEHELHSLPWTSEEPFAHTARAALYMTAMQAEAGFACPITMTFAVVPALRAQPELAAEWEPLVTATHLRPAPDPGRARRARRSRAWR